MAFRPQMGYGELCSITDGIFFPIFHKTGNCYPFFFFLLHFALGNPVDEKKKPPKLNGNMNTFTFNAVYNLSLWWVETSLNILAVISFEKINLACNSF